MLFLWGFIMVVLFRMIDFALLMMRRLCVWKGRSIDFFQEKCASSHIVFLWKHTVIDFDMQNRMLQKWKCHFYSKNMEIHSLSSRFRFVYWLIQRLAFYTTSVFQSIFTPFIFEIGRIWDKRLFKMSSKFISRISAFVFYRYYFPKSMRFLCWKMRTCVKILVPYTE